MGNGGQAELSCAATAADGRDYATLRPGRHARGVGAPSDSADASRRHPALCLGHIVKGAFPWQP